MNLLSAGIDCRPPKIQHEARIEMDDPYQDKSGM